MNLFNFQQSFRTTLINREFELSAIKYLLAPGAQLELKRMQIYNTPLVYILQQMPT